MPRPPEPPWLPLGRMGGTTRAGAAGALPPSFRVRPVGAGFHADWFVQFPKDLRVVGARYVVAELRESSRGGFYRAFGEIKKLG